MTTDSPSPADPFPTGHSLALDEDPGADVRARMAREINAFHSRTVPHESQRFAWLLRDGDGELTAGVVGVLSWQWLFIEAMWVSDTLRGRGIGRALMTRAEAHAAERGFHSAWLDTFQAKDFYLSLGYQAFGELADYPAGQTRTFMRKKLL